MSYEKTDGFKIRDQNAYHFLTCTIVGWIDLFTRQGYRDIIVDSMRYCQEQKGLIIGAWVIMSNHLHIIWKSKNGNLSDVLRDFKTFTSKAITATIHNEPESRKEWLLYLFRFFANRTNANKQFKVWTSNNHPEEIYSVAFLRSKLNYIHNNPVKAGIVADPVHYLYSSASAYAGMGGVLEIESLL